MFALLVTISFCYTQNKDRDSLKVKNIQPLPLNDTENTAKYIKNDKSDKEITSTKNVSNLIPKQWVYTIGRIYDSQDNFDDLNQKGEKGWELVSAVYYAENKYLLCIYKKPIY